MSSSPDLETWENATPGLVIVKKFDAQGKLASSVISPARTVHITPNERRINSELAANEELDVFKNGSMQPVRLIDGTEDAEEIASNPNHLSDSDIKSLVKGHHKTLDARLKEIGNPVALQRLLEAAKEADASHSTVERIKGRLTEVAPSLVDEIQTLGPVTTRDTDGLRAVTPR